jgi:uncharacterized membrane protein (DUF373 family)
MTEPESPIGATILKWSGKGKRIIAGVLIVLMFGVVGFVTLEILYAMLVVVLPGDLITMGPWAITEAEMMKVLGLFLSVLIALELIETVEVYFRSHSIHVEIVVLVAIIALARKIIILDLTKYNALTLFALGFLILVLGITYYLVKRATSGADSLPETH